MKATSSSRPAAAEGGVTKGGRLRRNKMILRSSVTIVTPNNTNNAELPAQPSTSSYSFTLDDTTNKVKANGSSKQKAKWMCDDVHPLKSFRGNNSNNNANNIPVPLTAAEVSSTSQNTYATSSITTNEEESTIASSSFENSSNNDINATAVIISSSSSKTKFSIMKSNSRSHRRKQSLQQGINDSNTNLEQELKFLDSLVLSSAISPSTSSSINETQDSIAEESTLAAFSNPPVPPKSMPRRKLTHERRIQLMDMANVQSENKNIKDQEQESLTYEAFQKGLEATSSNTPQNESFYSFADFSTVTCQIEQEENETTFDSEDHQNDPFATIHEIGKSNRALLEAIKVKASKYQSLDEGFYAPEPWEQ